MTSFDKVVKLACKPKANAPKAKYLDPIIAATWSEEGAVHDVCKALSPRFREPNAIVVFKALIVLHTMIRNGATDNVLTYLSSTEVLRLRNVSSGNWENYAAPENLQHYAVYLDSRIRSYKDLKHDAVKVQSETNRDMRISVGIDQDYERNHSGSKGKSSKAATSAAVQRSKTMMGRKLRVMSVDKGLLRETQAVQKMIDALVDCRFYLDDLEDELNITALRMLVKDLLILFQAGNEGVINLLEHYFEMSHVDAEAALVIYRRFCKQTELVVEFLGVAKKLQNLLNVEIPNLKHAPVSLAGALQEYLNDPAFEQNRIEYRANKEASDRSSTARGGARTVAKPKTATTEPTPPVPQIPAASTSVVQPEQSKAMVDFFAAIEEEQPTMFNPQTGSPTAQYFNQQAASNPFVQRQMTGAFNNNNMQPFAMNPQATGFPLQGQPTGFPMQMQPQPTGFMIPQQTAFPGQQQAPNPFGLPQQQQQQPQQPQHRPFASFVPQQPTGFQQPQPTSLPPPQQQQQQLQPQPTGFLQPQPTGSNPFRQSMGFNSSSFNAAPMSSPTNPFPGQNLGQQQPPSFNGGPSSAFPATPSFGNMPFSQNNANTASMLPPRPSSTPLNTFPSTAQRSASPPMQAVKTHQTGTRNPFGQPAPAAPPAVPKQPTMMELYMNGGKAPQQQQPSPQQPQLQQPQKTGGFGGVNAFNAFNGPQGGTDISSIASSFTGKPAAAASNGTPTPTSPSSFNHLLAQNTSTTFSSDSIFSSLGSQPTGATTAPGFPGAPNIQITSATQPPLKPQGTGFGGIKAFVPSSSFGASLLESLPSIPQSAPTTPAAAPSSGVQPQQTGFNPGGAFSGSGLGQGLRPQMTGGGGNPAANPFRMSMMTGNGVPPMPTNGQFPPSGSTPAFGGGQQQQPSGMPGGAFGGQPFGASLSNGANLIGGGNAGGFGGSFSPNPQQQQQQQTNGASLI